MSGIHCLMICCFYPRSLTVYISVQSSLCSHSSSLVSLAPLLPHSSLPVIGCALHDHCITQLRVSVNRTSSLLSLWASVPVHKIFSTLDCVLFLSGLPQWTRLGLGFHFSLVFFSFIVSRSHAVDLSVYHVWCVCIHSRWTWWLSAVSRC